MFQVAFSGGKGGPPFGESKGLLEEAGSEEMDCFRTHVHFNHLSKNRLRNNTDICFVEVLFQPSISHSKCKGLKS